MVAKLWLTDPFPELAVGCVLELGVSRSETHERVQEMDQSVAIQLPSAEDREEFLWNVWLKNVNVVEQF